MLNRLRSTLWKLLRPGQLTEEGTAAVKAAYVRMTDEERAATLAGIQRCLECWERHEPACQVVTLPRAELVTLLSQAMKLHGEYVHHLSDEEAIAHVLRVDAAGWDSVAEKLLDASLARRGR